MTTIVLFNSPPGSGKDHIVQTLLRRSQAFDHAKLAAPMYSWVLNLLQITQAEAERVKDVIHPLLGMSIRQAMIAYSEQFMKPTFGQGIWAILATREIALQDPGHGKKVWLVSDCGFDIEYLAFVQHFGAPRVVVVHLVRPLPTGLIRTFEEFSDSRYYVKVGTQSHDWYIGNEDCPERCANEIVTRLAALHLLPFDADVTSLLRPVADAA